MRTPNQPRVIDEAHYSGLIASMSHVRNRLLFFVLFLTYCFLGVISTTDKMLYLETPIAMPLLNIDLPLLGFYFVMPVFIVVLHFNLLYTFSAYRQFLKDSKKHHPLSLKHFMLGLYEGLLLKNGESHQWLIRIVYVVMSSLLYLFPVFVLVFFWFRFADYQSPAMSTWHFITIFISVIISFSFRGLLSNFQAGDNRRRIFRRRFIFKWLVFRMWLIVKRNKYSFIRWCLVFLFLLPFVFTYHLFVITPISGATVSITFLTELVEYEGKIDKFSANFFKRSRWFLPRITLYDEVLVPLDKYHLEIMQGLSEDKQPLLSYVSAQNKQRRNFRLAILEGCILPNTKLNYAQLQGANFRGSNLQGAILKNANLRGAVLRDANLRGSNLTKANLQWTDLRSANFQGVFLREAKLQMANLTASNFQEANLWGVNLQGALLNETNFKGAGLKSAKLQGVRSYSANFKGAYLNEANFQGAGLVSPSFQGAYIRRTKFQGAILKVAKLQGVFSNSSGMRVFSSEKWSTDIAGISSEVLTVEDVENLMSEIRPFLIMDEGAAKKLEARLQRAVGKDPIEWVKNQQGIKLGVLSKADYNEIEKSITNPKARKKMGLPPLAED